MPIRGTEHLPDAANGLEIKIGDGYRVAAVALNDQQVLVVYLVGDHNYVTESYIRLGEARGIFEDDFVRRAAEGPGPQPQEPGRMEERPRA